MARLASVTVGTDRAASGQPSLQTPLPPDCNFLHLLANSPAAFNAYVACSGALSQGQLTPRQRELLALTIAEINGAKYCLSAHYVLARKLGLTEPRFAPRDGRFRRMRRHKPCCALARRSLSSAAR